MDKSTTTPTPPTNPADSAGGQGSPAGNQSDSATLAAITAELETLRVTNTQLKNSVAGLEAKRDELLREKKLKSQAADDALAQQGQFKDLYEKSKDSIGSLNQEIEELKSTAGKLEPLEEKVKRQDAAILEAVKADLETLDESLITRLKAYYPDFDKLEPLERFKSLSRFRTAEGLNKAKPAGSPPGGGVQTTAQNDKYAQAVKSGNRAEAIRAMMGF